MSKRAALHYLYLLPHTKKVKDYRGCYTSYELASTGRSNITVSLHTTKTTTAYNMSNYTGFTNGMPQRAKRERKILKILRLINLYNIFRIIWTSVSSFPSAASLTAAKKISRVAWWRSTWPHSAQKQNICVLSGAMAVILRWVYCLVLVSYVCLCKDNYQEIALTSSLHCAQGFIKLYIKLLNYSFNR